MKVLHVTFGIAPYATGGLPAYVKDLVDEEKKLNNEIFILRPGSFSISGKCKIVRKKNIYEIINPLPIPSIYGIRNPQAYMNKGDSNVYRNFLKKLNPDIIHVHSIMGIHKEFFAIAKELKIKMVYTTHDYFGLCLRTNFINRESNICTQHDCKKCSKCNYKSGLSKKKVIVMQSRLYYKIKKNKIIKKIRTKLRTNIIKDIKREKLDSIEVETKTINLYTNLIHYYKEIFYMLDYFHFNSELSRQVFEEELGKLNGQVLPITLSSIQDHRKDTCFKEQSKLIIGYIGRKEEPKGIRLLINSLKYLSIKNIDYECKLYGDDFKEYTDKSYSIYNEGTFTRKDLGVIMENIDILIVPSIWKETFGFVTLESLSYGVPVIVTDNVGSKVLLKTCKLNPIVEISEFSLSNKIIEFAQNRNLLREYREWIQNMEDVFSMTTHTELILKMYKERIK